MDINLYYCSDHFIFTYINASTYIKYQYIHHTIISLCGRMNLHLHNVVCQLHLNKIGGKKKLQQQFAAFNMHFHTHSSLCNWPYCTYPHTSEPGSLTVSHTHQLYSSRFDYALNFWENKQNKTNHLILSPVWICLKLKNSLYSYKWLLILFTCSSSLLEPNSLNSYSSYSTN